MTVTSNSTWQASVPSGAQSWLSITQPVPSGGVATATGNGVLVFRAAASNCTSGTLSAVVPVTVPSAGLTSNVTVSQGAVAAVTSISPQGAVLFWGVTQQYTAMSGTTDVTSQVTWKVEFQSGSWILNQPLTDEMNQNGGKVTSPTQSGTYRISAYLNGSCAPATTTFISNWFVPPSGLQLSSILPINGSASSNLQATGWGAQVQFELQNLVNPIIPELNMVLDPTTSAPSSSANTCNLYSGIGSTAVTLYDDSGSTANNTYAGYSSCGSVLGPCGPANGYQVDASTATSLPSNTQCRIERRLNWLSNRPNSPYTIFDWHTAVLFNAGDYGKALNVWAQYIDTSYNPGPWGNYAQFVVPSAQPADAYLDSPADPGSSPATVSGNVSISGWAIDNKMRQETGISQVKVYVDGTFLNNATYGGSRPDVCGYWPYAPGCPNVGFSLVWNTTSFVNGVHTIRVDIYDSDTPTAHVFSMTRQVVVHN